MQPHFTSDFFKFFRQLKRHNNREWFMAHKLEYEHNVRDPFLKLIEEFRPRLHSVSPHFIADPRPHGGSLLRIYRDMRFRPDGDPYQTMAAARFPHEAWKQTPAPGFYLHLEPGGSFLGCGMWRPEPEARNKVREAIVRNPTRWKKILSSKRFRSLCELSGQSAQRMPLGYDPDHPLAEDLKRKDYITVSYFTDDQVCAASFLEQFTKAVAAAAPFMEFLTSALSLPWSSADRPIVKEVLEIESPKIR